jgi:predicted ribosomally synthesized peptide with nif11-like leader
MLRQQTIDYPNSTKYITGDIMAQSTVANFIQAVKADPSLIAELKAAVDIESYHKIAKSHGYDFTAEELNSELSERSLEEFVMTINPGMKPRKHLTGQ